MYILVVITLLTLSQALTSLALPLDNEATKGTELIFAFMIHRHGDRTPNSKSNTILSSNPDALQQASEPYGYGQLIDVGKQRSYALGQFIRERYGGLLSPKFNRSEMYVRSTDYTRAKMTALSVMAAVYPSVEPRWSTNVNWEPVPYTVVPTKYDFNLVLHNCPEFATKFYSSMLTNPESMVPYNAVLKELSKAYGFGLPVFEIIPVGSSYVVNDILDSQVSLGIPLTAELEALRPKVVELAGVAIEEMLGDKEYFSLQSGPLLQEFLDYSAKVIAGEDTQKVRVYSAHDLNVYALEAALQLKPKQGAPPYAALLSLELRKNIKTGEFSVLPVYVASPGAEPIYLQVEGCEGRLCSYDRFHELISPYALDEDSWRTKCGWTNDMEVDDSDIV